MIGVIAVIVPTGINGKRHMLLRRIRASLCLIQIVNGSVGSDQFHAHGTHLIGRIHQCAGQFHTAAQNGGLVVIADPPRVHETAVFEILRRRGKPVIADRTVCARRRHQRGSRLNAVGSAAHAHERRHHAGKDRRRSGRAGKCLIGISLGGGQQILTRHIEEGLPYIG